MDFREVNVKVSIASLLLVRQVIFYPHRRPSTFSCIARHYQITVRPTMLQLTLPPVSLITSSPEILWICLIKDVNDDDEKDEDDGEGEDDATFLRGFLFCCCVRFSSLKILLLWTTRDFFRLMLGLILMKYFCFYFFRLQPGYNRLWYAIRQKNGLLNLSRL